jgi:hypothetical protein
MAEEPVMRRIWELEERMRKRAERIEDIEKVLSSIRAMYPEYSHAELLTIEPEYRRLYFSRLALLGWQRRDQARLEELRKAVPPYRYLRIQITFSIDTKRGHQPFYAEVTCDSVIRAEDEPKLREIIGRIVNAALKLFFVLFDYAKCLFDIRGTAIYDAVERRIRSIIHRAKTGGGVKEDELDWIISNLAAYGGLDRPREEYVTHQAIIKIGVEAPMPAPEEAEPKYPEVHVLIEKGMSSEEIAKTAELYLIVSDRTEEDMARRLGMEIEYG